MKVKAPLQRIRLSLAGTVQGMGFRPFVYRLAQELKLTGWIHNTQEGITIEAEGRSPSLQRFVHRLHSECPQQARIEDFRSAYLEPTGETGFQIKSSGVAASRSTSVLPDLAACDACLKEVFDPHDRRHLYPFTNCTLCGPRYSIIESLPYDRHRTSMKTFPMCRTCQEEYRNPDDRRFHTQPNACPDCGPQVALWDAHGTLLSQKHAALEQTAAAIRNGAVVAVKGLGGFHLMVDAGNEQAVQTLRRRKQREEKPFALLFPSLQSIEKHCSVSPLEKELLTSAAAPIVLLKRHLETGTKTHTPIAGAVAPGNPCLGILLPHTPLHHILMGILQTPVVATSGNRGDESLCSDEHEALQRLNGIADFFLVHDRPIVRPVDDSIVRVILGEAQVLRRARGHAPAPFALKGDNAFAVGGHLKNTVAIQAGGNAIVSPHIGDLESAQTFATFENTLGACSVFHNTTASVIARDFHPEYASSQWAEVSGVPTLPVQHHVAHALSCMAEHDLQGPLLAVAWDGSGYGLDGTLWGGEFFTVDERHFHRIASLAPFPLPGGETAMREPRRSALGLLHAHAGNKALALPEIMGKFSQAELNVLKTMLVKNIQSPRTSSIGRLFDAAAALCGIRDRCSFEGQAAMELEFALPQIVWQDAYPFPVETMKSPPSAGNTLDCGGIRYDWNLKYRLDGFSLIQALRQDVSQGVPRQQIASRFHNALVEAIVTVAKRTAAKRVVLTGGCFQNRYLTERAVERLRQEGCAPFWHRRIPPNDGGLSLGQLVAASWANETGG